MSRSMRSFLAAVTLVTVFVAGVAAVSGDLGRRRQAQPKEGQQGKDVMWVPTPARIVDAMLDLAQVSAADHVVDLGSGDGRIVIAAAKRGARAVGIEFNRDLVEISRSNALSQGVAARASFIQGDLYQADLSHATVLTLYLLPEINARLRPQILDLAPGTRVVSHAFNMQDWEPDQTAIVAGKKLWLWIVPARTAGDWIWNSSAGAAELTILQKFQRIEGVLKWNGKKLPLKEAKMHGAHISFAAGDDPAVHRYSGTVAGGVIRGSVKIGPNPASPWTAKRRSKMW